MFGAWIRRTGFWTLDVLKGAPVRKHYKDIVEKRRFGSMSQVSDILSYARIHVPFYKAIESLSIEDFPVMSKPVYKQQGINCISDEYPNFQTLHRVATSGSTGTPMVVYQDRDKRNRVVADLIHAHEMVGWKLGEKYVFIRNWTDNYGQSKLKKIAENVFQVNIATFDDEHKLSLYNYLRKHSGYVVFGYSSSICDFMQFLNENKLVGTDLHLRLIICDSDELTKTNKVLLEKTFRCPVISRYDNEENGLIGITTFESDSFVVNYESLFVELLSPDSNERVSPGEVGRVVITDLYSKAMPLIRYDTGDLARSDDDPANIRSLSNLCGRRADCLRSSDGLLISAVAISGITEIFDSIIKYQLVQNSSVDFVFRYVGVLSKENLSKLDARLKDCLGLSSSIEYEVVDELQPEKNGKFKTIVNYYS